MLERKGGASDFVKGIESGSRDAGSREKGTASTWKGCAGVLLTLESEGEGSPTLRNRRQSTSQRQGELSLQKRKNMSVLHEKKGQTSYRGEEGKGVGGSGGIQR